MRQTENYVAAALAEGDKSDKRESLTGWICERPFGDFLIVRRVVANFSRKADVSRPFLEVFEHLPLRFSQRMRTRRYFSEI